MTGIDFPPRNLTFGVMEGGTPPRVHDDSISCEVVMQSFYRAELVYDPLTRPSAMISLSVVLAT